MPGRLGVALSALLLLATSCIRLDSGSLRDIDLAFEQYTLPNGLDVILRKDDRVPVVSVNVWYHVGPANEVEGRRGFAHLFEHMMLQGSGHAPGDYFTRLQAVGATGVNGNTDLDRTSYLQDVPSEHLELALWAEADRMGFLLDAVDLPTLRNQQDVIRSERRQTVDNAPYGLGQEEVYRLLFPPDHPYHHHIFGSHEDMQAADLEDIRDFHRRFYAPNNASLALVGNFDIDQTKEWIEKYFATIVRGPDVPEVNIEVPEITEERRAVVTDTVELPRVYLAWITPEAFSDGDARASLAARMLGGGKASRLYRDLVHDLQIAQSVSVTQRSLSHGSVFQVTATAKPGTTAQELEEAIGPVLDRMAAEGPGDRELEAAKTSTLAITVRSLEPTTAVADRLNAYNHFLGDPGFLQQDLERVSTVTAEEIRRFAEDGLAPERRVVVHVNPGEKVLPPDPPVVPDPPVEPDVRPASSEPWRFDVPGPGRVPDSELPVPDTFELDNGLTVYLVRRPELPLATVQLTVRSGSARDPENMPGLAAFTADMLNEGAGRRSSLELANDISALGSTLETGSSREGSWVVAQSLKHNLDETLEIMGDVILRPVFSQDEVERIRRQRLASLQQQRNQPLTTAFKVMWREHYGPDHPYGYLGLGTEDAINAIDREDLLRSYRQSFSPKNAALIMTGDFSRREARRLARGLLGEWEGDELSALTLPAPRPSQDRLLLVDRPGAPQTALVLAQPGIARRNPDFARLQIVNQVLGGLFSSRLNQNLRETRGYSYGVSSMITQNSFPGLVYVSLSADAPSTADAVVQALSEVSRLKEGGISRSELNEARQAILRSLPARYQTNGSTASSIANLYVLGLPQDHYAGLEERLEGVTVGEIGVIARKYLHPDAMKIMAVGDLVAIEEPLRTLELGPVGLRTADAVPR